ncbi:MAG: hypothetical protein ACLQBL_30145 [Polyangiaceae bacterium]
MKEPALFPNRPTGELVARAQQALGMTHRQFGEALGASERTSLRWASGRSSLAIMHLRELAKLTHPKNASLAQSIAEACSETLESLGIVAPSPPEPAPPPPPLAPHLAADLVVYAAADALGSAPKAARTALLAAFTRARELGVRIEDLESALAAPAAATPKAGTATSTRQKAQ